MRNTLIAGVIVLAALGAGGCHKEGSQKVATEAENAATRIVERNAVARGGLKAWRAVTSMSMSGTLDAGVARDPLAPARKLQRPQTGAGKNIRPASLPASTTARDEGKPVSLPFVLELQRPRRTRFELTFGGDTAVQVYDGTNGWKVRPFLGRRDADPYTPAEAEAAAQQQELDGPLVDCAAKGTTVELEATEPVEGRDAYKLKLTLKDGQVRHVWVDTETALEVKIDGSRRQGGKKAPIETYFRDYRPVDGLMIPFVLETKAPGVKNPERIIVEHVTLNPPLDPARFTKPG